MVLFKVCTVVMHGVHACGKENKQGNRQDGKSPMTFAIQNFQQGMNGAVHMHVLFDQLKVESSQAKNSSYET